MSSSAVASAIFAIATVAGTLAACPALAQQTPLSPPSMTAPGLAPPAGQPSALRPRALKLFPDSPQGVNAAPLTDNEFPETRQRLLLAVEFDPAAAGTKVDVAIVATRTTAGLEQAIFTASDKVDAKGRLPIELKLPRNWPVGYYDVRLGVNERLIATLPFKVAATAPRSTPIKAATAIAIIVADAQGKPALVASPKASNRQLNFMLDTTGSETSGAAVTWTVTAVATSAGNDIAVGENTIRNWPLENTRLPFDIEMPRDWPTGKYRVEVKIDGKLLNTLHFDIQP